MPRLIAARHGAEAIATVARQGDMRFVPVNTIDQQLAAGLSRVREGYKTESVATRKRVPEWRDSRDIAACAAG